MITNLQAVLFDLDGTILDSGAQDEQMLRRLLVDVLHMEPDEALMRELFGVSSRKILETLAPQRVEELLPVLMSIHDEITGESRVFSGVPEATRALAAAGLALGVVTSQTEQELAQTRRDHPLPPEIQVWVTADGLAPKPSPESVLRACEILACAPQQTIMIGDTHYDIEAGKAAGTHTGAALWGTKTRGKLLSCRPDLVFRAPHEMEKLAQWKKS